MDEIERKYLARLDVETILRNKGYVANELEQFYTHITPQKTERYRRKGDRFIRTVKHGSGAVRQEFEDEVDKATYLAALDHKIGHVIRKRRYAFDYGGLHYDIDIYKGELAGLATVEAEFDSLDTYERYVPPSFLRPYLIEDVSQTAAFKNASLALHGIPQGALFPAIFDTLDTMDHASAEAFRIGNVPTCDALRILLYQEARLITHYARRFVADDDAEDLHRFRVHIRKSRTFLKAFKDCFDPDFYGVYEVTLSNFAVRTNKARDLDVLPTEKIATPTANKIAKAKTKAHAKVVRMLQSDDFAQALRDYRSALRSGDVCASCDDPIAEHMRAALCEQARTITALRTRKRLTPRVLHRIRIRFKRIRYLLEASQAFLPLPDIEKKIAHSKALQDRLGAMNDAVHHLAILRRVTQKEPAKSSKKKLKPYKRTLKKRYAKALKALHKWDAQNLCEEPEE